MTNPVAEAYRDGVDDVIRSVGEMVEGTFEALDRIAAAATELWERLSVNGNALRSADLGGLRGAVLAELGRQGAIFNGAGLVLADGLLADRPRHLEWWRAAARSDTAPQKLTVDLNPDSDYFFDYSAMEWFVVPRDRGIRWIAGPYLDYTGIDLYICTFAVPVHSRGGVFLGIAGADVTVGSLDAVFMPVLRSSGTSLALVNHEGRVIVANNADHVSGSRMRGAAVRGRPVPGTQWTLITLDSSQRSQ